MNIQYASKLYEPKSEMSVLEEVALNLEKQHQAISNMLNSYRFKESFPESNIKLNRSSSVRSKKSPSYFSKISPHNGKVVKDVNPFSEDLTEVTITEAITEPSESLPSIVQPEKKKILQSFKQFDHRPLNSGFRDHFMLLAPDDLFLNSVKYNERVSSKRSKDDNGDNRSVQNAHFPLLLEIETNNENSWNLFNSKKNRESVRGFEHLFTRKNLPFINEIIENHNEKENDLKEIGFAVPPELVLEMMKNKRNAINSANNKASSAKNEQNRRKSEFIRQNLLIIDFDDFQSSEKESIMKEHKGIVSPEKNKPQVRKPNEIYLKKEKKGGDDNVDDDKSTIEISSPSVSEQNEDVIYHGYLINDDGVIDTKNPESRRRAHFSKKKPLKNAVFRMNEEYETADLQNSFDEMFLKDEARLNIQESPRKRFDNDKLTMVIDNRFEEMKIPVSIRSRNVPVLPPDLLGNLTLRNADGHVVKRFLGVKSIDESGWAREHLEKIDMSMMPTPVQNKDNNNEAGGNRKRTPLNFVAVNSPRLMHSDIDRFTVNILDPTDDINKHQRNLLQKRELSQSLQKMDSQIREMEQVSMEMEKEFAHSKSISLGAIDKLRSQSRIRPGRVKPEISTDYFEDHEDDNDKTDMSKFKRPLAINAFPLIEQDSHQDNQCDLGGAFVSETTSTCCCSQSDYSQNMLENTPSRTPKDVPRIDLNMSGSDGSRSDDDFLSLSSNRIIVTSAVLTPQIKSKKATSSLNSKRDGKKFRNEIEQINYWKRKEEGKALALKMLNELGLPPTRSSEIPVKISKNPSANEMMLSEIRRNQAMNSTSRKPLESPRVDHQMYKPIRQKSFINKVRLQRPEVTREKKRNFSSFKKKIYGNNGSQKINNNKRPMSNNDGNLTPRSIISQDTDIISLFSDWSVPDNVNRMLYGGDSSKFDGRSETNGNMDDLSQIVSIQSNSVIDWDQVSEMLKSPALR